MKLKTTIWGLIIVCVCSFSILLSLGSDIYREAPPLPKQVITNNGDVVFTYENIDQGQLAWRSMGGLMCQHFSGHKFTQILAGFRILLVTNSHLQNVFSLGYKRPQYIQI